MRPEAGAHLWDAAEAAKLVHEFAGDTTAILALIPTLSELVAEARGAAGL